MSIFEAAAQLHRDCGLLVAHMDLPAELHLRHQAGESRILETRYLPRLQRAGIRVIIGAVFVHPMYLPEQALSMALAQIAALQAEIAGSDRFCLIRTSAQLDAALQSGRIGILLSLEGAEPLGDSPALLHVFHELGVRLLSLTWNSRNAFADGCALQGCGLTAAGETLVQTAQELGMLPDVSHLNDAGFDRLMALCTGPVIASHSNCRPLCDHPRNLTDAQIVQIAGSGGVIGVNQIRFLVRDGAGISDLCQHILHLRRLGGPGCVGLGLDLARDYMEALPKPSTFWQAWDPSDEDILTDYADLTQLTAALLMQGISPQEIAGILSGNFLRVLRQALP